MIFVLISDKATIFRRIMAIKSDELACVISMLNNIKIMIIVIIIMRDNLSKKKYYIYIVQ